MKVNYRIVLPSTVTAVTFQAIRAGSERNHTAEAYHLLKAKKWNRSHSVVMQQVASDAVVNGNRNHYILRCDNELFLVSLVIDFTVCILYAFARQDCTLCK